MKREIPLLKESIRANLGCEGHLICSDTVLEKTDNTIIWEGEVYTFQIQHPPGAPVCSE